MILTFVLKILNSMIINSKIYFSISKKMNFKLLDYSYIFRFSLNLYRMLIISSSIIYKRLKLFIGNYGNIYNENLILTFYLIYLLNNL